MGVLLLTLGTPVLSAGLNDCFDKVQSSVKSHLLRSPGKWEKNTEN
jgi:hypothetical protein